MREPILVLAGAVFFMGGCGRTVRRSPAQPSEPAPPSRTQRPPPTGPAPSP